MVDYRVKIEVDAAALEKSLTKAFSGVNSKLNEMGDFVKSWKAMGEQTTKQAKTRVKHVQVEHTYSEKMMKHQQVMTDQAYKRKQLAEQERRAFKLLELERIAGTRREMKHRSAMNAMIRASGVRGGAFGNIGGLIGGRAGAGAGRGIDMLLRSQNFFESPHAMESTFAAKHGMTMQTAKKYNKLGEGAQGPRPSGEAQADLKKMKSVPQVVKLLGVAAGLAGLAGLGKMIIDSSPVLKAMLKLLNVGIMLILRPIGDFIGFMLRPMLIKFIREIAIPAYRTGAKIAKEWGTKFGTFIVDFFSDPIGAISGAISEALIGFFGGAFKWPELKLPEIDWPWANAEESPEDKQKRQEEEAKAWEEFFKGIDNAGKGAYDWIYGAGEKFRDWLDGWYQSADAMQSDLDKLVERIRALGIGAEVVCGEVFVGAEDIYKPKGQGSEVVPKEDICKYRCPSYQGPICMCGEMFYPAQPSNKKGSNYENNLIEYINDVINQAKEKFKSLGGRDLNIVPGMQDLTPEEIQAAQDTAQYFTGKVCEGADQIEEGGVQLSEAAQKIKDAFDAYRREFGTNKGVREQFAEREKQLKAEEAAKKAKEAQEEIADYERRRAELIEQTTCKSKYMVKAFYEMADSVADMQANFASMSASGKDEATKKMADAVAEHGTGVLHGGADTHVPPTPKKQNYGSLVQDESGFWMDTSQEGGAVNEAREKMNKYKSGASRLYSEYVHKVEGWRRWYQDNKGSADFNQGLYNAMEKNINAEYSRYSQKLYKYYDENGWPADMNKMMQDAVNKYLEELYAGGAPKYLAKGGIINEPILGLGKSGKRYVLGESGPETVIPGILGKGGKSTGMNQSNTFNITINGATDARDLENKLKPVILKIMRDSRGRVGIV